MNRAVFELAGVGFEVRADASDLQILFPDAYKPFIVSAAPETGAVFTVAAPPPSPPALGETVWQTDCWKLSRTTGDDLALDLYEHDHDHWRSLARVSADFSQGSLFRRGEDSHFMFNYPCDQVLVMNRLTFFGAGVVHSCGIVYEGRAYLFCGRSGAGKTTIARLWRDAGATIMNDDRIIIRMVGQEPRAGSTPWHGDEKQVRQAFLPLGGVFHLRHAEHNRLTPLTYTESVARLMATTIAPFYARDGVDRILDVWARALEHTPSWALDFTPDARAIATCREALAPASAAG